MCMCFAYMYVYIPHVCLVPQRPDEGVRSPETGATDGFKRTCGCWESNLGLLWEQPVLIIAEWFLQPSHLSFWRALLATWLIRTSEEGLGNSQHPKSAVNQLFREFCLWYPVAQAWKTEEKNRKQGSQKFEEEKKKPTILHDICLCCWLSE